MHAAHSRADAHWREAVPMPRVHVAVLASACGGGGGARAARALKVARARRRATWRGTRRRTCALPGAAALQLPLWRSDAHMVLHVYMHVAHVDPTFHVVCTRKCMYVLYSCVTHGQRVTHKYADAYSTHTHATYTHQRTQTQQTHIHTHTYTNKIARTMSRASAAATRFFGHKTHTYTHERTS